MIYIVTALTALIGGYIAILFGFKTVFLIMLGISLLSVVSSVYLLKNKSKWLPETEPETYE